MSPYSRSTRLRSATLTLLVAAALCALSSQAHSRPLRSCETLFESRTTANTPAGNTRAAKDFEPATRADLFFNRHIASSGLERLSKAQLVILFTLRDHIRASENDGSPPTIRTTQEAGLVTQITKRNWNVGDALTMKQFENQIALPAFKLLAFKAAVERLRMEPQADPDEMFQAALIGLTRAIRVYETSADTMFSTWAYTIMKGEFYEVARQSTSSMAMATTAQRYLQLQTYLQVAHKLAIKLGRAATNAEIAIEAAKHYSKAPTELEVRNALDRWRAARSTNATFLAQPKTSEDIDEQVSHEFDAQQTLRSDADPVNELEIKQARALIAEMLFSLTPREQMVLGLRFGIDARESARERNWREGDSYSYKVFHTDDRTLQEIGDILGLTRERMRQIEAKAIQKMKHPSRADDLLNAWPTSLR